MYKYLAAAVALSLVSCAEPQIEVAETASEPKPPASKPVKIPARSEKKGKSSGMGLDELYPIQQTGNALIYDVRVPYFFNIDHIPGAVNWPHTQYEAQVSKRDLEIQKAINEGTPVVLYCFNIACSEARNVAKKLTRRGYDVSILTMGIDSWRSAGLPLETPSVTPAE